MKKALLGGLLAIALLAGSASLVGGSEERMLVCHITERVVDATENRCLAVVIEVSASGAAQHAAHGDPPGPPGASAGDLLIVGCP